MSFQCKYCSITCSGHISWQQHEDSEKHKKKVRAANCTSEASSAHNDMQIIPCAVCNVRLLGMINFQAHVNSLEHADMVKSNISGSVSVSITTPPKPNPNQQQQVTKSPNPEINIPMESLSMKLASYMECKVCQKEFSGPAPYQQHIVSALHKKKCLQQGIGITPECQPDETLNVLAKKETQLDSISNPYNPGSYTHCEICDKHFSGPDPYNQHIVSEKHKKKRIQEEIKSNKMKSDDSENSLSVLSTYKEDSDKDASEELKEKNPYAVCKPCDMQFSGFEPYQLHLESAGHQRKTAIPCSAANQVFKCDLCNVPFTGPIPYDDHLNSKGHKKKMQNNEFLLKHFRTSEPDSTTTDYIAPSPAKGVAMSSGVNESYYCKICDISMTGPEPYQQHMKGEPHRKKAKFFDFADTLYENTDGAGNKLPEQGMNLNNDERPKDFYISQDLILCDALHNIDVIRPEDLNITVFRSDDEIVFDNIKMKISSENK